MLRLVEWLATLPAAVLYLVIGTAAFVENIFPPLPADSTIALGAFVAARGNGSAIGVWFATMVGNVGGAMLMYYFGHRFGIPWLEKKFPALQTADGADRFQKHYKRYGIPGLVLSRFLPGIRAVVPPVAGAMRIGAVRAALAMTLASSVWYAIVCAFAFRAGENADNVLATIARSQRVFAIAAAIIVLVGATIWWIKRKRSHD